MRNGLCFQAVFYILIVVMPEALQTAPPTGIICTVLFDIDGTLVAGPEHELSAGVRAMSSASIACTGKESAFAGADYAGRTDVQIARMLLQDAGTAHPTKAQIDELIGHYVRALGREITRYPFHVLGSPRSAVEGLRRAGAVVGLGTGNVRAGGFLKLNSAGIGDLFSAEEGGFGDDGETRAELLEKGVRTLDPRRDRPLVIVGDTPWDVEGAHQAKAVCIGVPFGQNSRSRLEEAGADVVVDSIDQALVTVIKSLLERRVS